ncbi:MAG: hypothetical protein GJ676_10740 [Rhodobacteraceae bacterium]|nr:hypothetical protein [Paracoccaceae bacterium]
MRNLNSKLKHRRRNRNTMQRFDTLPKELRQWLSTACLPWSPESALGIWKREGDPARAVARLNAVEQAMLRKDAGIWEQRG